MSSPSSQPAASIVISQELFAQLEERYPGLSETMSQFQQQTSDAQVSQPTETIPALVCPPDVSQNEAQEYAKKGLSYETRPDGVLVNVWKNQDTGETHRSIHNWLSFVNNNRPLFNFTWEGNGIVHHEGVKLEGSDISIWHFNRIGDGLSRYISQLQTSGKQVKLADDTIIQSISSKFGGQMHKAFGIPLTAWSHPDGGLVRGDVGLGAGLWLDRRCLVVRRVDAWVGGGDELYGLGLFLQDTSSDT